MTTFSVTRQATQLYLGDQPTVTVYNQGPFTVYFDSTASINDINSFSLPPFGQMTWKNDKELWAKIHNQLDVAAECRVVTSPAGNLSITTRSRTQQRIFFARQVATSNFDTPFIEVGQFSTLLFRRGYQIVVGDADVTTELLAVSWFDDDFNLVYKEQLVAHVIKQMSAALPEQPWDSFYRVPVKARYCKLSLRNPVGWTNTLQHSLTVYGSDVPNQAGVWSQAMWAINAGSPAAVSPSPFADGSMAIPDYLSVISNASFIVFIPTLGTRLQVAATGTLSADSIITVSDTLDNRELGSMIVPAAGGRADKQLLVPSRRALTLTGALNIAAGSATVSLGYEWDE